MGSEAEQDRWNNIIRSLREEELGQIIRLNPAEWKRTGGKLLTPPSCSQPSNSQLLLRATDIHAELSIYGPQTLMLTISTGPSITPLQWRTNREQRGKHWDREGSRQGDRFESKGQERQSLHPVRSVGGSLPVCDTHKHAWVSSTSSSAGAQAGPSITSNSI